MNESDWFIQHPKFSDKCHTQMGPSQKKSESKIATAAWNLGITFGGSNPIRTRIQETWAIFEIPSSWYMSPVCSDVCVCVLYVFFWVNLIVTAYWIAFVYIILYKHYIYLGRYVYAHILAKDDGILQWFFSQNTHWKLQPESVWKNSPLSLDSNNLGQAQKVQRRMGEDWCLRAAWLRVNVYLVQCIRKMGHNRPPSDSE